MCEQLPEWSAQDGLERYEGNMKAANVSEREWEISPDNPESRWRWCEAHEDCAGTVPKEDGKVCQVCREDPTVAKGWKIAIPNTQTEEDHRTMSAGWYFIEVESGSTIFASPVQAALAHFHLVRVSPTRAGAIEARDPKTAEARVQVALTETALTSAWLGPRNIVRRAAERPVTQPSMVIPSSAWVDDEYDNIPSRARLLTGPININGIDFSAYALEVVNGDKYVQQCPSETLRKEYYEPLAELVGTDTGFQTMPIEGKRYVVFLFPQDRHSGDKN